MTQHKRMAALAAVVAIVSTACGAGATGTPGGSSAPPGPTETATTAPTPTLDTTPVTITVWDYYGADVTPLNKEAVDGFSKQYPWITVDLTEVPYDDLQTKFANAVGAGEGPDVATLDLVWIPTFAANDYLADVKALSGDQLNGKPWADQYTPGGMEAVTYGDKYVGALFDFDAYALYYRADLFDKKGITVPKTWDELVTAAKKLAEDRNGDGKPDHYLYAIRPNTFHLSQFLFQEGGSLLSADQKQAAFNSDAGVAALAVQKQILDAKAGLYWPDADGDLPPALVDERVAMFSDGPYYMGLLKDGVPKQAGKWKVALAPYSKQPGSYLGGTVLGIAANAKHPQAAWLFSQYMLLPEQQVRVFTAAGAAPATTAALEAPELSQPDTYFGGQAPFTVFLETLKTATPFPKVGAWTDIDQYISDACAAALLGQKDIKAALDAAAQQTNAKLGQ